MRVCETADEAVLVPDEERVKVIAVMAPVQGSEDETGLKFPVVFRIDCPNCGHQHLIYKRGAGNFDLFCYGKYVPISIETVI